jgi:hypothetical protein
MLPAFIVFLVFGLAYLKFSLNFRMRVLLVALFVFACLMAFVAFSSVGSVWMPRSWPEQENSIAGYQGIFPFSKLLYPFYLTIYYSQHDPMSSFGQVHLGVFFANMKVGDISGAYQFRMYGAPDYTFNFFISNQFDLFTFLLGVFGLLDICGALLGVVAARVLKQFLGKQRSSS